MIWYQNGSALDQLLYLIGTVYGRFVVHATDFMAVVWRNIAQ